MECTHCGADNLMGAITCFACGTSLFGELAGARPKPAAEESVVDPTLAADASDMPWLQSAPASDTYGKVQHGFDLTSEPPPAPATDDSAPTPSGSGGGLCSYCRAPLALDEEPSEGERAICGDCRNIASPEDLAENDVQILPATSPAIEDPEAKFRDALGSDRSRPLARRPKTGLRLGPIMVLIGIVLCLITAAVVVFETEEDRTLELLAGVEETAATLRVQPEHEHLVSLESRAKLRIAYEELGAFTSSLNPEIVIDQTTVLETEMAFDERVDDLAFVDLRSTFRVERQTGVYKGKDAADKRLHPWRGHDTRLRLVLHESREPRSDEGAVVAGRDLPPFATLSAVGAPAGPAAPGLSWKHEVVLPVGANKRGQMLSLRYPCTFRLVGTKNVLGHPCTVVRVESSGPSNTPDRINDMNRRSGHLRGVLFFDGESGVIVQGSLDVESQFQLHSGRLQEQLRVTGRLDVARR